MPRRTTSPHRRRGVALKSLLTTIGVSAALGAGMIAFRPALIRASQTESEANPQAPMHPKQRQLHDDVQGLLARSKAVIATHERGPTPYAEILIWTSDENNVGVIDPEEIAVISHSRILRTVTIFSLNAGSLKEHQRQWGALFGGMPGPDEICSPRFCDTWRGHPEVRPMVLGTDVTDMHVTVDTDSQPERSLLHLDLQWNSHHPDMPEATVLIVDAAMQRRSSEQTQ